MACILPLLVKQNIGLAFVAALVVLIVASRDRARLAPVLAGLAAGAALATAWVALVFGLENYIHWTIRFAAERRLPPLAQQLAIFTEDQTLWWWLACAIAGALLVVGAGSAGGLSSMRSSLETKRRMLQWTGAAMFTVPMLWSIIRFFVTDDPLEPEINLLRLWPFGLACTGLLTLVRWRRAEGALQWLPLLVAGTVAGTFLSQSTWGSTYGIWPLLLILLAFILRELEQAPAVAGLLAAPMLLAGWPYVRGDQRLASATWGGGPMQRAS